VRTAALIERSVRTMKSITRLVLASSFTVGIAACGEPPPLPVFPITFIAESDPGTPLPGVTLTVAGAAPAQTAADGTVRVELSGEEGTSVPVTATCPEGYRHAAPLSPIVLRTTVGVGGAPAPGLRVGVQCLPEMRHGVVVIRAGGTGTATRAGLPVMIEGREVARTDSSGIAHVSLNMPPGQSFQVLLATATVSPMLRPQDPQLTFVFPDANEIFAFDENFDEEAPPEPEHHRRRRAAPPPTAGPVLIPVRIPSGGGR
jgi:hypothetical protein